MPHNLTEDEPLTIFMPDLCRTVHLEFERSGQLGGLPYNKYAMTEISFDNCKTVTLSFINNQCSEFFSFIFYFTRHYLDIPVFI